MSCNKRFILFLFHFRYTKLGYAGNTEPQFIIPSCEYIKTLRLVLIKSEVCTNVSYNVYRCVRYLCKGYHTADHWNYIKSLFFLTIWYLKFLNLHREVIIKRGNDDSFSFLLPHSPVKSTASHILQNPYKAADLSWTNGYFHYS